MLSDATVIAALSRKCTVSEHGLRVALAQLLGDQLEAGRVRHSDRSSPIASSDSTNSSVPWPP